MLLMNFQALKACTFEVSVECLSLSGGSIKWTNVYDTLPTTQR